MLGLDSPIYGVDSAARFAFQTLPWLAFTHTLHSPMLPSLRTGVVQQPSVGPSVFTGTQRVGEPFYSPHRCTCTRLKWFSRRPNYLRYARVHSAAVQPLQCDDMSKSESKENSALLGGATRNSHNTTNVTRALQTHLQYAIRPRRVDLPTKLLEIRG
jgi:hypothetical protein